MTNEKILTDDAIHKFIVDLEIECDCGIETYPVDNIVPFARAIEQAVLQSPEIQALRKDAVAVRRETLLSVLGKLNSNPYSLTKSECIDVVREMLEEADDVMEQQK